MVQRRTQGCQAPGIVLSKRLGMLAGMVTPGNRLADVGCDHGFLSIYLVQSGICPEALAMDVRPGPLAAAGEHVEEAKLGDYIHLRLSDGLEACRKGEADTLVCAGMGGRLMERILTEGMDRARELKELILQPQSEIGQFRAFLRGNGFRVMQEEAVCEEGKYYFAMKAVYVAETAYADRTAYEEPRASALPCQGKAAGGSDDVTGTGCGGADEDNGMADCAEVIRLYDLYGEKLLTARHPVLLQYLRQREGYIRSLETSLAAADSPKAQARLETVRGELADIEAALSFFSEI